MNHETMSESIQVILSRIERIEQELEELKQQLIKLKAEKDESEEVSLELAMKLAEKAEHLKNHPEEGLTADEAVKQLL